MAEGGVVADEKDCEIIEPSSIIECAVCLQPCVHPAELPCGHIFCYLCIKGIVFQSGRCAMCRDAIPEDFLFKPKLLTTLKSDNISDNYQWYYEGGSGWWQYDPRASAEIEESYQRGEKACNLLLAGYLYVIDFKNMVQYRQTNPVRRRRIKRDRSTTDKLGVAGLTENLLKKRMEEVESGLQRLWQTDDTNEESRSARTLQSEADNLMLLPDRFPRQDTENYSLWSSLGPDEYPDSVDFRALSPSQRDGRCFNPRLDLCESGDDDSDEVVEIDDNDDEPRRILSGPSAISSEAFRPLPMRMQGTDKSDAET